jgi:uncharacterized protein YtpQ (UPF0354 family)
MSYAPAVRVVEEPDGIFMVGAGGNYEATLLLVPRLLRRVGPTIDGDIVVGIPNRDLLFVTGDRNAKGIASLRYKVEHFFRTGDHPLSDKLFLLKDGEIVVFHE